MSRVECQITPAHMQNQDVAYLSNAFHVLGTTRLLQNVSKACQKRGQPILVRHVVRQKKGQGCHSPVALINAQPHAVLKCLTVCEEAGLRLCSSLRHLCSIPYSLCMGYMHGNAVT